MFGAVASEAPVWRTFDHVGSVGLCAIAAVRATARARAWSARVGPAGDKAIIDVDSTIVRTCADKQDAAPTYKRTFGHHPLLAMRAETGEMLAGILRAGNAGAHPIDHVLLLSAALAPV